MVLNVGFQTPRPVFISKPHRPYMFPLRRKKDEEQQLPFSDNIAENEARIVVDEDGVIVFASAAFMNLGHLTRDTIRNYNFSSILTFENQVETPQEIESGSYKIWVNGNQSTQDFHFDWVSIPASNGNRRFLIGSYAEDGIIKNASPVISPTPQEEKQPGTPLQSAHSNHDDIDVFLNLSREMMIVTDQNDKILRANSRFSNAIGYSATELDNIKFIDLFDAEDKDIITHKNDCEARILSQNGEVLWVEWHKQNRDGMIYYAGHDITAIKTQQKALNRRAKQLSQAEKLGRMGHWQWVLGEDSIEWSSEIYRIFGVEKDSFETTLDNMNEMVHTDDIDRVNQALQRAVIEENDYDVEFTIIRPDGEERFIRSEGRCSSNDDGEVVALFGIMQDMTERMLYERELKSTKDAAERAYAAKTQFLANMSHELRTPLNAIIGFSEMMEQQLLGPLGNEKYLDYIGGIRESGTHLLDLISDILDMSKIEAGKYELALEELNINKIIQLSIHMMEGRANEASVKITSNTHDDDGTKIVADRRGLLQIMLNLLSNAVKFSNENDNVTVECEEDDDGIIIKIIDNGIGIPANKLATITNPFEQVSSSYTRDHEGSGLGLAITKELAELHGGSLAIESTIDVGTNVTVRLPFEPPVELQQSEEKTV